ncbi:MAG: hypothetical protein D8M57_16885 [Candidatus Scalindua sp. AMX11]|nr:MAG: hypothetical protein DWQ00_12620 [Candidatus Scalindua sp.]NOG85146.1 hypothetical protein [Planctomycetota bacterium]RZV67649.1 MAG: hypothetical protein EX341_16865 [Candidatus Scalindua sp. SCAELEC01]TDE63701.1 MAG: hypothetical protein D8M57_16885 [Candidatus Scalindua sp. AMX11]GJQ57219.1 MAG: hypothetical protein SCALA701_00200 [Candidatus Scalindua sp.]
MRNQFKGTIVFLHSSHSRVFLLQDGIKPYKILVKALSFNGFKQFGQDLMDVFVPKLRKLDYRGNVR